MFVSCGGKEIIKKVVRKKIISGQKTVAFTIGHSTRSVQEFVDILKKYDVKKIVDIRTIPRSRHNPQFNRESLPEQLKAQKIGYLHVPGLGGLRHSSKNSINTAWRNSSFRGFADYMQTEEFEKNLEKLIDLARKKRIVLMCAEAVPWRCHRSLIADALLVRGIKAEHIISATNHQIHNLTPWAKVRGTKITYPGEAEGKKTVNRSAPGLTD